MSGSSVPRAPAPTRARSDLATDVDKTIHLFCEKADDAAELLPDKLSEAAGKEVRSFCADITRSADRVTGDIQAVALHRWDLVSEQTKKELAQLAQKAASKYKAPPPDGRVDPMPDVTDLTKGQGKQYSLGVPVKFASHTDVKLLVNVDQSSLLKGKPFLLGGGVGATYKDTWGDVSAAVSVDTSRKARPDYASFILVNINFP